MYEINTIPHGKCFVEYLLTPCFVSEIEWVRRRSEGIRFLVQKQVPKYLTPSLSMKYSLFITLKMFTSIVTVLNPPMFSEQT